MGEVLLGVGGLTVLELGVAGQRAQPRLGGLPTSLTGLPASASSSQARSSSYPSTWATRSGQRSESSAVRCVSNACTGAHALNQATPSASGTRRTVAHGCSCTVCIAPTGSTCPRIHCSTARVSITITTMASHHEPWSEFALSYWHWDWSSQASNQAWRRAVWSRSAPGTPFSSTGPISVNATGPPSAASTTSWLTSTSPGLAYSPILAARFTVRPK
jgi:hypothetical protein